MATTQLPLDFKEFLQSLTAYRVEHLLVGGYAVGFHGYPRATVDLDVWVARNAENADRLLAALEDFGFGDSGASKELLSEADRVIRMGLPPLRIEIQTTISGVNFEECYARRIVGELGRA